MIRRKVFKPVAIVLSLLFFLISSSFLIAQVRNNSITNRTELILDNVWLHSSTANASVEWKCVNKSLTKKCLVYHNDQWLHFTPIRNGKFFLNISSQQCRDAEGVQVVVIEGNPCEISTYRILRCIPKIHQDDLFIELDSLKANTLYLVNVDGFLGDFCEFDIQLSSRPNGLPQLMRSLDTLNLKAEIINEAVSIQWHAGQSLAGKLQHFEVYRSKQGGQKSEVRGKIQTKRNAYGKYVEDYVYIDTVQQGGEYQYRVMGVGGESGDRELLDQLKINFKPEKIPTKQIVANVPLSFKETGRVEVFILNNKDGEILNYWVHDYVNPEILSTNLTKFVEAGIQQFQIKTRNNKTKEVRQHYFQLNEANEMVLMEKSKM